MSKRPTSASPLGEARDYVLAKRERGVSCPCCGLYVRVYRRRLNYAMAYGLFLVYEHFAKHPEADAVHMPSLLNGKGVVARGGDVSKLVHWGLLARIGQQSGPKRAGEYYITDLGRDFVEGRAHVPEYLLFFKGEVIGREEGQIYMGGALANHFDLEELLGRARQPSKRRRTNPNQTSLPQPGE